MNLKKFKTFILDLDGTIWNWERIFPGVSETISKLRMEGKQVLIVTNNSLLTRRGLVKKLKKMGIDVKEDELITSCRVICEYLRNKSKRVFVIGKAVDEELRKEGMKVTKRLDADYLVVGHEFNFGLKELLDAYELLKNGAKFLTTARGRIFYMGEKVYPATGVFVSAIEHMSGKKAILMGKPSRYMISFVDLFVCSPKKETLVVGDELNSDIKMGILAGYSTCLVKTGIDRAPGRIKPNFILNSIADLRKFI